MVYLGYEQVAATASVKTKADFGAAIPAKATHAELQASAAGVRYTMDNATDPTTAAGMVLLVGTSPKLFLIEDVHRIRFCRSGGVDGVLHIHYLAGRNV